jgi:hypothetical protein
VISAFVNMCVNHNKQNLPVFFMFFTLFMDNISVNLLIGNSIHRNKSTLTHTLQQSQHTPSFDQVTGISHIPHGNMLACLGPRFSLMSPDWIMMSSMIVVHCSFAIGSYIDIWVCTPLMTFVRS